VFVDLRGASMVSLEGKNEQTCFVILPSKLYE
jgi:hypothetical protein